MAVEAEELAARLYEDTEQAADPALA